MGMRAVTTVIDHTGRPRRFWAAWASPEYQIPHLAVIQGLILKGWCLRGSWRCCDGNSGEGSARSLLALEAIVLPFDARGFDIALIARNYAKLDDLVTQLGGGALPPTRSQQTCSTPTPPRRPSVRATGGRTCLDGESLPS